MTGHDRWYPQGSTAFSRVVNLSDALFAIALTLLVLGIDVPRAGGSPMGALAAQAPQLFAVAVSFGVRLLLVGRPPGCSERTARPPVRWCPTSGC